MEREKKRGKTPTHFFPSLPHILSLFATIGLACCSYYATAVFYRVINTKERRRGGGKNGFAKHPHAYINNNVNAL